jgi:ABC-type branched-subunit amino acid transport system ATPase component
MGERKSDSSSDLVAGPSAGGWESGTEALRLDGVSRSFGGLRAVDAVTLGIAFGSLTILAGPNGSGKTTLFDVMTGFVSADEGTVSLCGRLISGMPPHAVMRLGVARLFQTLHLPAQLRCLDIVLLGIRAQTGERLHRAVWGRRTEDTMHRQSAEQVLAEFGLLDLKNRTVAELSYGQQKLVGIASCVISRSPIMLLDEPLAGLQPEAVQLVLRRLRDLAVAGTAILIIEHNLSAALQIADRVVIMQHGRKIVDASPQAAMADPTALVAFLGGEGHADA